MINHVMNLKSSSRVVFLNYQCLFWCTWNLN